MMIFLIYCLYIMYIKKNLIKFEVFEIVSSFQHIIDIIIKFINRNYLI